MTKDLLPIEMIEKKIYLIRSKKVMLDRDLAELYGVETRILNQAVKRNIKRFPDDFLFKLTREEINRLSQFVITSDLKFSPNVFAFTEQGIAMLSGVLNSNRAINVNIQIMRTFTILRELMTSNELIRKKIEALENKYDYKFKVVFQVINKLLEQEDKRNASTSSAQDKKYGFKPK